MDTSANDSFRVITRAGPNRLRPIVRPNTLGTPNTYMSVGSNTWEHIVYQRVAGSDEIKSYKNGVETGSAYASVDPVTLGNDITIGAGNATYLNAMLDDIRWFNKSLTQSEITHLATSRGIEGPPPVGLGDEKLWLCPSLNDSANDISGNGNDGVYQGGMGTVTSEGKLCYDFDGTNDYIDVSSSGLTSDAFSVSLWERTGSANSSSMFNTRRVGGSRVFEFEGMKAGGSGENYVYQTGSTVNKVTNTTTRFGATWYHVSMTYDGDTLSLYIDGQLYGSVSGVPVTSYTEDRCWIGQYIGGGFHFEGKMDDIRTYARALTQAEITHLATSRGIEGSPSTPPTTGFYNPFINKIFNNDYTRRIR